ncbi:MAG: hypothetical protein QM765_13555 [Myxococcales bacterium]
MPKLELAVVQRLNDLAFEHGTQVVSVCAGHAADATFDDEGLYADVRFAIFYPRWDRLAAQQARICIEALARRCAAPDTIIEVVHEPDLDRRSTRREYRLGRMWAVVHHARPTAEAPELAQEWWHRLVERLADHGP